METRHLSNIFDPIQRELDQTVFKGETPRPSVVSFIKRKFYEKMKDVGHIADPELFLELVLTGSLTTYQYSETSDADVSVIADYDGLMQALGLPSPGEVRRHLVRTVTSSLDGTFLPGTQHPLQYFVNPPNDDLAERYKPGVRSGYHLQRGEWLNPPEKDRSHDVQVELPELYSRAEQMADKMRILLDGAHNDEAMELFAMIHNKRGLDENEGLGDFSEGNIVYKYLLHEGLFDRLKGIGVHIASELDAPPAVSPINFQFVPLTDAELAPWDALANKGPWISKAHAFNARARKAGVPGRVNGQTLYAIWNRYQGNCAYDGEPGADTFDHVVPMWQGGDNTAANLLPAHKNCNASLNKWDHKNQTAPYQINMSDKWYIDAEAGWHEKIASTYKVIYDYERDRIILSENLPHDHVVEANHVILGGYDGENVNLGAESKQWLNANYFKRLWMHTFPGKTLSNVYINDTHVPTRDKEFMTYLDKNPAAVNNPEVFKHVTADKWRKGKDWKDFIKNKGVIVEFKIGSDETFDGKVTEVEKEYVKVQVAPGETRKLENELLKSMKFRVRDDKSYVSSWYED